MSEFRMPSLGADMEAGTLIEWRVHPGDAVKRGDIVALVETEKGIIEVEIFESGTVESLVVQPGQKVPVGATLAIIGRDGLGVEPRPPPEAPRVIKQPAAPEPPASPSAEPRRARISPLARKRAEELGIDLSALVGTGEGGSITGEDVERAAGRAAPATPAPELKPADADKHAAMRRAIAAAMARSKREIPHYYLATTIDMRRALEWLAAENAKRPVTQRLLYSALLIRAVGLAVREVPEMNGFWVDGAFRPGEGVHVGVAISLRQGGLVNPAIHDADKKTLDELMTDMLDLVNRARTGRLRSSELSDGTITVTILGEQGVQTVFGVIYPPQVALVGFGKVTERPIADKGMIGIRPVIEATLSGDHRVSDGHRGGRFLAAIDRLLQAPEKP
jgi:pyruvate dehydrogenase E2 component (dihydrolipoamide acetyltransferase)